jgi:hypothetical protein
MKIKKIETLKELRDCHLMAVKLTDDELEYTVSGILETSISYSFRIFHRRDTLMFFETKK